MSTILQAGVIGWPIGHSRSPKLHGHWLRTYGIAGRYDAVAVTPEELPGFIRRLADDGWRGCNVTIPHKEAVFGLVDRITDTARRIGAINTVIVEGDGRLLGHNTDGFGFIENLRQSLPGFDFTAGAGLVLGAGGAGRAVVAALQDAGVPEIRLANRNRARAEALAASLPERVTVVDWPGGDLGGINLVVNATSLGMTGQPALDIALNRLPLTALVTDLVYVPLETPLLAAARARGNPVVDGLGMLLHQARPGFAAWFGREPEVTDALRAAVLA